MLREHVRRRRVLCGAAIDRLGRRVRSSRHVLQRNAAERIVKCLTNSEAALTVEFVKYLTINRHERTIMADDVRPQVLNQLRELSMMMIRNRTRVARIDGLGIYGEGHGRPAMRSVRRGGRSSESGERAQGDSASVRASMIGAGDSAMRGQGRVLLTLTLSSTVSQRDLATILGLSRQALGQLLSKLEAKGYVSRQPSQEDKRVTMVQITDKGKQAASQLHDSMQHDADIFDCLSDEELAQFSGYLNRIIDNIERKHPKDDFIERRKMMREAMREFRRANRQEEVQ